MDRLRLVRLGRHGTPPADSEFYNKIPYPSFENGATTGWFVANAAGVVAGTFATTTGWSSDGDWSLRVSGTNAADTTSRAIGVRTATGTAGMLVEPGEVVNAGAALNVLSAASQGFRCAINWYKADGSPSSVTASVAGALAGANATGIVSPALSATAPADAAFMALHIQALVNTVSDFVDFYVDAVFAGNLTSYAAGDTPGWGWMGPPDASASGYLVSLLKNVENSSTFFVAENSFQFKPGDRVTSMAAGPGRYSGERPARDRKPNGEVSWAALVQGATADLAIQAAGDMLGVLESTRGGMFVEWRPEGVTNSTFFEVRGPAKWTVDYSPKQFACNRSFMCQVAIPVAPIPQELPAPVAPIPQELPAPVAVATAATVPAVFQLPAPVPGDAPALVDVAITHSGGSAAPVWAMIAWTRRPTAPLAGSIVPFGDYEAETVAASLTGWALTASGVASGGNYLAVDTSGAGSASALIAVDPSTLDPDEFRETVDIEVWARVNVADTLVSPTFALSLEPFAGTAFGGAQFSAEHGSPGKRVPVPVSTSNVRRPVKLGTLTMPVDPTSPLKWNVKIAAAWAAGSAGRLALDKVGFVIAKQCALGKTGVPNDATYPAFIASTAATTKTIRSDLSGRIASGSGNAGPSSGLGGQLLELPPGDVDMFIKLSSVVPDDPTASGITEQLSHTVDVKLNVTPRHLLARGT